MAEIGYEKSHFRGQHVFHNSRISKLMDFAHTSLDAVENSQELWKKPEEKFFGI